MLLSIMDIATSSQSYKVCRFHRVLIGKLLCCSTLTSRVSRKYLLKRSQKPHRKLAIELQSWLSPRPGWLGTPRRLYRDSEERKAFPTSKSLRRTSCQLCFKLSNLNGWVFTGLDRFCQLRWSCIQLLLHSRLLWVYGSWFHKACLLQRRSSPLRESML